MSLRNEPNILWGGTAVGDNFALSCLALILIVALYAWPVQAADAKYIYIKPEDFSQLGTWTISSDSGAFRTRHLQGRNDRNTFAAQTATVTVPVPTAGTYRLWARTRDYSTQQGTRYFQVQINEQPLLVFGRHGVNGWAWENGGTINLNAGSVVIELRDTSAYYARVDGLLLTNDLSYTPPATYQELMQRAETLPDPVSATMKAGLAYPEWARHDGTPTREITLSNRNMRVHFYTLDGPEGPVVQQAIEIRSGDRWVQAKSRSDEFGFLLMYALSSKVAGWNSQFPVWEQMVKAAGRTLNTKTADVYASGIPTWLVPTSMRQTADNTVAIEAENDLAHITATWQLDENGQEPVVTWTLRAKQAGAFSVGMMNGPETPLEEIDFLLLPHRFLSKRLPDESYLVTEAYAPTPISLMALPASTMSTGDGAITYGIVADPSVIPNHWANAENSRFGLAIRGRNGGVQPALFAPLMGTAEARLDADEQFTFTYRPIIAPATWFDVYKHVVLDVFQLTDYRQNYYSSLTDAVFNTQALMLDDHYSGWDSAAKAHDNMEGRNVASLASPLTPIQSYLLTEDPVVYEKRTLPTLEYLLTRGSFHFSAREPGGGYLNLGKVSPVGDPVAGYGNSVYGGAYLMTRGQVPALRSIGIDSGLRYQRVNGAVTDWAELTWLYKYTGNPEYLTQAKAGADRYIKNTVYGAQYTVPTDDAFINVVYTPYWSALLDLYEISGDKQYLDAAVEGAHQLLTLLWTQPGPPAGDIDIAADTVLTHKFFADNWNGWYRGNTRERLGHPESYNKLQDETVPAWVPARVGLGIEQTSTFRGNNFSNILMSNWAPDLLRLAHYTGDALFETYARNAVIGRFANYPGYYQNQLMVHHMQPDYPYSGPDLTNIYYHHIPAHLAFTVDFLMTQAWKWSNEQVMFPSVRQQGYVWFNNRSYGFAPGKFFDEEGMWPWLKPDLVQVDNKQVDWIAARKDGLFGCVLMNEDGKSNIVTTVRLGTEIIGDQTFSGTAHLMYPDGSSTEVSVTNGQLQVSIPPHGLVGIKLDTPRVKAPVFAEVEPEALEALPMDQTVVAGSPLDFARAVALQIDPQSYYAYVYLNLGAEVVKKAVLHYQIGDGTWQTAETSTYPYEFTIRVDDASAPFTFFVEILNTRDDTRQSPTHVIRSIAATGGK